MQIESKSIEEWKAEIENEKGIIVLGCEGDTNAWVSGITGNIHYGGHIKSKVADDVWSSITKLKSMHRGFDIVFVPRKDIAINWAGIAKWGSAFGGVSWISDYKLNHANLY